ncbi:MAG: folate-binding protein [Rubrivivax sp.]|nr:folate-binding protein [Rubrivivax sp.]
MSPSPADLPLPATQGARAVRLHDWGVIRAAGDDARKFLHGQLTQDVEHLEPGRARLAGFCSAKGRLMATFVVWGRDNGDVLLACSADLLPTVLKRLQMFVLRAKCKLSDASADVPLWGLVGPLDSSAAVWDCKQVGAADWMRLPDGGEAVARWLWAGAEPEGAAALQIDTWRGLEASSGVARVMAATAEQFVPQMINLELVGGVNFQKGCYPGQEIVARSQYRGTLKRRAQVLHSDEVLQPGQEVFHAADPGQPAGRVVLSGRLPGGGPVALVELKLSALDGGTLHAGAADGPPLRLGALPYAIPAEQA